MGSVAFVTNGALSLTNFRGSLIEKLTRDGVQVWGLAPDFTDASRQALRAIGAEPVDIRLARAGTNVVHEAFDTVALYRTLRRLSPDVVFSYFAKPVIYGTLAARAAGVRRRIAMIEGLGYVFADEAAGWKRSLLRNVTRNLFRVALSQAERTVFTNRTDIDDMVGAGLVDPARVVNLGGIGVDLATFAPVVPRTRPVTFLLAARLLREKGVVEFAEAARRVRTEAPGTRFVLLGGLDPNPGSVTEAEIAPFVADGSIEWPGHVTDVRRRMEDASVFVLPSYYREGVPRSTQEAMALGLPIITTDNVGCRDTVEDGVNGYLVPVRSVAALADAMRRFVAQPEAIVSMGRESRRLATERFDAAQKDAVLRGLIGL